MSFSLSALPAAVFRFFLVLKILKLHVEALSTKYPSIKDASEEVVRLYKKFSELEKSGKPLPEVPKAKKTKEPER